VADSQGQQWAVAGVAAADRGSDLVLLTLAGAPPAARLALGESTGLRPGGAVTVIGSPLGLAGSVLNGSLAARRPVAGSGEWLQLTAPLAEGASGAPVLAADGTVAGVASLAANGLAGVGFAVPAEAVAALRERAAAGAAMPFPEWARRQARVLAWQGITADAAWREAQRLLQAGERAAAFRQLEQLAQRDPENPLLLVQLARLTAAAGRPELALPFLAKAAALDGEDPWVHLELARTARATGQVPPMEILGHLRQAVAAAPGHALAWLDLGVALEEAGDRQGAAAAYRRAAALAPGLTAAQEARNRLSAGSGARP
jgi:DNA-binding SARP family transcriptional activator